MFKKKKKKKEEIIIPDKIVKILVIDYDSNNWEEVFKKKSFKNSKGEQIAFQTEQNLWKNLIVTSYDSGQLEVQMKPNAAPKNEKEKKFRSFSPDFLLVRQLVNGMKVRDNNENALLGFLYSGIESINDLESLFLNQNRVLQWRELKKIEKKHGKEKFPLIEQNYYSEPLSVLFTPKFPIIAKFGDFEAGYGKIKIDTQDKIKEVSSLMSPYNSFVTMEPFINKEYDLRIQKIGKKIRAYKRQSTIKSWKTNVGSSILEEIKVEERYKFWVEECGKMFKGMDILTVDAMHCNGKEFIIEVNGCASGFYEKNKKEDMIDVCNLVIEKILENKIA